ncbi:MAG TPA: UTP--glucose-1-phosphate uridylyltransferase [Alphaproteobacteria bacterium]|nr:UTP--glucose-1-phosphate uridylyltransferase [Paracoccaceae bacterium]RCL80543.1 MAG: UTP--glucose-1-phosphate uridylyltransferase [SAR116 cluster bacterium]HCJ61333.1 UTP--glucose-1-phosphate uridylyltransferase [Alphaproteobacteria bacterium]HCY47404.1 UTP--glucose-1-phosphate uridylyltransferase [Alphaproteobacteria bacterium]
MMPRIRKAIFPVAGMGTRFLPATKAMPKEMLPVVDKPIIQYAVEEAREAGIEEFIFVTGRGKTALEDHFDRNPELERLLKDRGKDMQLRLVRDSQLDSGQIAYTRQYDPLGLGHAVLCARHLVNGEPFAVILPDDLVKSQVPCLKQMVEAHERLGGNLVAVMEVEGKAIERYGVITPGERQGNCIEVRGVVEKPSEAQAPSNLAVIGRYILEPKLFSYLSQADRGAGGEIQLTDSMAKLIVPGNFHGVLFEGERFDCGDKAGFVKATIAMALARDDIGDEVRAYLESLQH